MNPIEGIAWCEAHAPDVLLLDYVMPKMDGLTFLRQFRQRAHLVDVPVVIITAEESPQALYEALHIGANDFLKKPVDPIELTARTRNMLRLRARQQELKHANAELARLANTDGLTGAANRRYYLKRMSQELERARRYGGPVSVALIDVDHFKAVNDSHGHQAGDEVLRCLTASIMDCMRRNDLVGRLGGEEFAVLMPETDSAAARIVAERIRAETSAMPLSTVSGMLSITVSIGVAQADPAIDTPESILHTADQALYLAKDAGRNQVCLAPSSAQATEMMGNGSGRTGAARF